MKKVGTGSLIKYIKDVNDDDFSSGEISFDDKVDEDDEYNNNLRVNYQKKISPKSHIKPYTSFPGLSVFWELDEEGHHIVTTEEDVIKTVSRDLEREE